MTATDLHDVVGYIHNADDLDLSRITEAVKERRKALASITAASVRVGSQVTLSGLSPQYLNGLTGEVTGIENKRCRVLLDKDSTITLRWSGSKRFNVRHDAEHYLIPGIPLQCAKPTEDGQQASNG